MTVELLLPAGELRGGCVSAIFEDYKEDLAKLRQRLTNKGLTPDAVRAVQLAKPGYRDGVRRRTRHPADISRRFQSLFVALRGKLCPLGHQVVTLELEELLLRTLPIIEGGYLSGQRPSVEQ
jgi:hypothetical protein